MQHFLITATYHRSDVLTSMALPSILRQSDQNFCWILVNDGGDGATRELAQSLVHSSTHPHFELVYREMPHPAKKEGFGLCHARNLGLATAKTCAKYSNQTLISYLDDDNRIAPNFVTDTKQFFQAQPSVRCSMTQQWRSRVVVRDGQVVQKGKPFVAPIAGTNVADLVTQRALFDSNGFSHVLEDAPSWNPLYRVFTDYEYFLQCLDRWGRKGFKLNEHLLVDYIQSSQGVIGQSSYGEWVDELQLLLDSFVFSEDDRIALTGCIERWQMKALQNYPIPAFAK